MAIIIINQAGSRDPPKLSQATGWRLKCFRSKENVGFHRIWSGFPGGFPGPPKATPGHRLGA